ncbi:MAG: sigma-54-dependent transcriptional regulator [Nitrospirota bacterium]
MNKNILIIDDEVNTLKVLTTALKGDYAVKTATSAREAFVELNSRCFDLILCDYKLPDMDGIHVLEQIKKENKNKNILFVMFTAYGTIERAVEAMRKGAYTYLTKPVNSHVLLSVIKEALSHDDKFMGGQYSIEGFSIDRRLLNIVGKSKAMKKIFSLISRVSRTDANVLITGETGTGKELVAKALHFSSLRASKPFVTVDCTMIPSNLLESELFGYNKGAFTGAYSDKIGLIEMADGGTIFFGEIGELDISLQKKLLRFIQEKEFNRLGGKKKIKLDVRIVSATNRDIEDAVKSGAMRSDLFHRLNVISISVPPLRARKEDIILLSNHFLSIFNKKLEKSIIGFDSEVTRIFLQYDWPGNVRELENCIERAVILCNGDFISIEVLPYNLLESSEKKRDESIDIGGLSLQEIERRIVLSAMEKASWNKSKAAEILGISRKQLLTKLKKISSMNKRALSFP